MIKMAKGLGGKGGHDATAGSKKNYKQIDLWVQISIFSDDIALWSVRLQVFLCMEVSPMPSCVLFCKSMALHYQIWHPCHTSPLLGNPISLVALGWSFVSQGCWSHSISDTWSRTRKWQFGNCQGHRVFFLWFWAKYGSIFFWGATLS